MPIHVSKVRDKQSSVTVSYGDEKATVHYNQNALSTRAWREIRSRSKGDGETVDDEFSVAVLSQIITKWDVMTVNEDKKPVPYPTTKDALDELPPQFLNAVVKAIVEDLFPSPEVVAATSSFGS
jgi:hypothetical protein